MTPLATPCAPAPGFLAERLLAGLGSVIACGCLLPLLALGVIAIALTYCDEVVWLAVIAILLVVGLVAWLVRPRAYEGFTTTARPGRSAVSD